RSGAAPAFRVRPSLRMSRPTRRPDSRAPRRTVPRPVAAAASLPRAAWVALATLAVRLALLLVTFPFHDKDLWQHLEVGRVIWAQHAIPRTHVWTWPTYGAPDVLPSWLFRALLYPFWAAGGEVGLYAWRWITLLAAFGPLFLAARAAGARGPWML